MIYIKKSAKNEFLKYFFILQIVILFIVSILTMINFGYEFQVNIIYGETIGLISFLTIYTLIDSIEKINSFTRVIIFGLIIIICTIAGILTGSFITNQESISAIKENPNISLQVIILTISVGFVFRYFQLTNQKIQKEKIKRLILEKEATESRLKILQAQIEPHFLFNTLSNILSLMETTPEMAKTMMSDFIFYLRISLSKSREDSTTIEEEIKMIESYLNIFKARLGKRLSFNIICEKEALKIKIPPMLLQPIVENSIIHGIEPSIQGGSINLKITKKDKRLIIIISDTGEGVKPGCSKEKGFGLLNISTRLKAIYSDKASICVVDNKPRGLKTILEVPYGY